MVDGSSALRLTMSLNPMMPAWVKARTTSDALHPMEGTPTPTVSTCLSLALSLTLLERVLGVAKVEIKCDC